MSAKNEDRLLSDFVECIVFLKEQIANDSERVRHCCFTVADLSDTVRVDHHDRVSQGLICNGISGAYVLTLKQYKNCQIAN